MISLSKSTKFKSRRKNFFIKDKDNLVKITQPNFMEVTIFYSVLLEKIKKSKYC
jgi:hypothetical protein